MAIASAPTQVYELKTVVNLLINAYNYSQMEIYQLLVVSSQSFGFKHIIMKSLVTSVEQSACFLCGQKYSKC